MKSGDEMIDELAEVMEALEGSLRNAKRADERRTAEKKFEVRVTLASDLYSRSLGTLSPVEAFEKAGMFVDEAQRELDKFQASYEDEGVAEQE